MNPVMRFHTYMNEVHDVRPADGRADLPRIDLNLLVAFDALARERNVTRAAQQLGMTQSALSHALRRLRALLGDPLLVRGRGGMMLTPRAEALVIPLRSGLVTLERALSQSSAFDPQTARRGFRIATPDLFDVLVLPTLLKRVREQAPGVDLSVVASDPRKLADRLETGELDCAVAPQVDDARFNPDAAAEPGLVRRTLLRDRVICLLRADHPVLQRVGGAKRGTRKAPKRRPRAAPERLTLDMYIQLSHLVVSMDDARHGMVDTLLADRGLKRRVALRVAAHYSALRIVAHSDLILTAPSALASLASAEDGLAVLQAPLPIPTHSLNLVWHERFTKDPAHEWLRASLAASAQEALAATRPRP